MPTEPDTEKRTPSLFPLETIAILLCQREEQKAEGGGVYQLFQHLCNASTAFREYFQDKPVDAFFDAITKIPPEDSFLKVWMDALPIARTDDRNLKTPNERGLGRVHKIPSAA